MQSIDNFRQLALSFPETTEQPHFDMTSFRVMKKIFATFDIKKNQACIKLSIIDQDVFSVYDRTVIYPVPNKWGRQGWTYIDLEKVHPEMLIDALTTAYCCVAPQKLSSLVRSSPAQ
ncbi:MAG: MmcQ/YjbR family DNA-binding protein [Bacteroidota bacterium]